MSAQIEQEVKLRFTDIEAARRAVITAGGRLVRVRRVQDDRFFDRPDASLTRERRALRVRREPDRITITYKGAPRGGPVKSREEIETTVADADVFETMLTRLGFIEIWRATKHREDYNLGAAHVFVDDTQAGVFVEIEGTIDAIAATARALGKSEADYILDSYRTLYRSV